MEDKEEEGRGNKHEDETSAASFPPALHLRHFVIDSIERLRAPYIHAYFILWVVLLYKFGYNAFSSCIFAKTVLRGT